MYIYIHVYTYKCICIISLYMLTYVYMCVHACMCLYVYMCTCAGRFTHTHTSFPSCLLQEDSPYKTFRDLSGVLHLACFKHMFMEQWNHRCAEYPAGPGNYDVVNSGPSPGTDSVHSWAGPGNSDGVSSAAGPCGNRCKSQADLQRTNMDPSQLLSE